MQRKNNKKGFTLAELLIVVAIIAVLVAIAVPIFVGALTKAKEATIEANERTLRGMVVAEILSDDTLLYYTDAETDEKTPCTEWYAKGVYNSETDEWTINKADIKGNFTADGTDQENPYADETSGVSGSTYTLYVTVKYADIK